MSGIVGSRLNNRGSGLIGSLGTDGQVFTSSGAGKSAVFEAGAIDDNAVTLAKMAGLARGNLIYGDTSGDPAALAVGGADEVLTHDGTDLSWAAAGGGGGLTGADQWRTNTSVTGDVNPLTNLEQVDTGGFGGIGNAMTESSGIFTFPTTGYWYIQFTAMYYNNADSRFNNAVIKHTTDNSTYSLGGYSSNLLQLTNGDNAVGSGTCSFIFDVTDVSQCKCQFYTDVADNDVTIMGSSTVNQTHMTFIRLGDT